jgi:hypothetical protein
VGHAPKQVLRAVATDAEIGCVTRCVIRVPDVRTAVSPKVRDGIAKKQNVSAALLRFFDKAFVSLHPSRIAWDWIGRCILSRDGACECQPRQKRDSRRRKVFFHAVKVNPSEAFEN